MENWPAKVICFGLALGLYLVHITSLLDRKTYTVPLKLVADGGMYPMSDYPEYVRITVRSTAENIAETLQSDFSATIDLTKYEKEGSFSVPVSVHLSPKLLLMDPFEIKLNPESVSMRLGCAFSFGRSTARLCRYENVGGTCDGRNRGASQSGRRNEASVYVRDRRDLSFRVENV